jgi:hypothetical protein
MLWMRFRPITMYQVLLVGSGCLELYPDPDPEPGLFMYLRIHWLTFQKQLAKNLFRPGSGSGQIPLDPQNLQTIVREVSEHVHLNRSKMLPLDSGIAWN